MGTASYWRDDQLGQTDLDFARANKQHYVVSGLGDGGLVDVFRLTIRDFRYETIFHEIFGAPGSKLLRRLDEIKRRQCDTDGWLFDKFSNLELTERAMLDAMNDLRDRLRSDTKVTLNGKPESLRSGLSLDRISLSNALLTFCLFRIGAIHYECGQLNKRGRRLIGVPAVAARPDWLTKAKGVIIRHGTDRALALKEIGFTKREINFIRKQSNTGNLIYPDGWWGRYTRPDDAANDWSTFTPVEFVPPAPHVACYDFWFDAREHFGSFDRQKK